MARGKYQSVPLPCNGLMINMEGFFSYNAILYSLQLIQESLLQCSCNKLITTNFFLTHSKSGCNLQNSPFSVQSWGSLKLLLPKVFLWTRLHCTPSIWTTLSIKMLQTFMNHSQISCTMCMKIFRLQNLLKWKQNLPNYSNSSCREISSWIKQNECNKKV